VNHTQLATTTKDIPRMVSSSFPAGLIPPRWTPQVVGDWIIEAMETARRLPPHRPRGYVVIWPDMEGERWDYRDPSKHDGEEIRCAASSTAISKHDEVQRWLSFEVLTETDRKILKAWALRKPDTWIGGKLNLDRRKVKRLRGIALRGIAMTLTFEGNG